MGQLSTRNRPQQRLQDEIAELREELAVKKSELNIANKWIRARGKEITDGRQEIDTQKLQLAKLKDTLKQSDQEYVVLLEEKTARDLQVAVLQRQMTARDQDINHLQSQLATNNQQVSKMQSKGKKMNQLITVLRHQLTATNLEVNGLERQLAEKDQQVNDREDELETMIYDLQQQLTEKDKQVDDLQDELETMRDLAAAQDGTGTDRELNDLQQQLAEKDQQVNHLQDELETMRNLVAAQDRAHSESYHNSQRDWIIDSNEIIMTDEVLGGGAWGRVVRGKFRGSHVAVKGFYEDLYSTHNRELFQREVDIAARCRHPCLLQFIGATNDERPLLVMELMDRSLRSLYEERRLTETEIYVISLDVAQALNYLHQTKPIPIIHRDITSANVLLWRRGDQWRGKVSDYGTANFVRQCARDDPGAVIYCAPEALGGARNQIVSCKLDVYSFGVLLCEMCIRELPHPERRDQQIAMVRNRPIQTLIRECVQREPGSRPNMETIIDRLKHTRHR